MSKTSFDHPITVRGTEILPSDTRQHYREKIARITLDSMVQFVGLLDAKGTVLEINKVALDAVGIKLSEVEGRPFWTTFWWQVSEDINVTLRESIARAAQGEFVRWDTPIYGRAGGKETIIIDASLCPVMDEDGKVVFIAAEGRDITEKKVQEREIAQKNLELQGLLERIRELDEIKTQFFANVSHELRTPLALILGPAQRLIDDENAIVPAERREAGEVIARNARMLLRHVNDLLDISKLEARKLKIDLKDTDVSALIRFLGSHFAVLAADRKIEFVIEANESCVAAVDSEKLQRIVMNLLGNAFKFVNDGGRVRCRLRCAAHDFRVSVDDSGPGVPVELRTKIFERFRQGDGGTSRAVGGTGLGLAIAKEFVELHKGSIEVQASDFGGASFEVIIPLVHVPTISDGEPITPFNDPILQGLLDELRPALTDARDDILALEPTNRPVVLVVEDNPDMNHFVCSSLASDYRVIAAFDGREGLEKAIKFQPATIVSDIMMPNMSGAEMVAEIRKHSELKSTPILLLSAKADEDLRINLLDAFVQDFIVKPFSERELIVRVRNLVAQVIARQEIGHLRDSAETANRAKDEFLAMLGHELRNPLSPIVTALQLMKLQGPERSERARTVIERQVNHLIRLVDDLLDVSRIAPGKVALKKELLEIAEVVAKGIEMVSPLLEQRSHKLIVDVPRHGLLVEGDPTRLGQVVSNLLTNAAKYTPAEGEIGIRSHLVEGEVLLIVTDTGIGIAPEVLPHIFDLFVQERQAIDRSQGGLGLGLTIVRNLVSGHGGSISARSQGIGYGSEFTVRLPAVMPSRESTDTSGGFYSAAYSVDTSANGVRILVIDDNQDGAEILTLSLAAKGFQTRAANDALSAIKIAGEFLPTIAVVDIGLPVMDGYELASHLRNVQGLSSLRLIALTGYGQESDRRKSREAGFEHHLVKPVDIEALEKAIAGEVS
jgi:PAS domain S-box-containing protein